MQKVPMTALGAHKLREQLEQLKTVDRPKIIKAIAEARAHGDLKKTPNTTPPKNSRASLKPEFAISKASYPTPISST